MTKNSELKEVSKSKKPSQVDKLVTPREQTLAKQEERKAEVKHNILNRFLEDDDEYDKRLEELRKQDVVHTTELKLKHVVIPGYRTHWASTDPKTVPSVMELKRRGYRVMEGYEPVPTGHHSIDGAGFHILMAIPDDLAKKRVEAHQKKRDESMAQVKKAKTNISPESDRDFMFEKNEFKKTTIGELLG